MGAAAGVARPQPGQVPAQGGKGGVKPYTPIGSQPQIPSQGKGQNLGPNVFPAPQIQQSYPQQPLVTPMRDQNPQVAQMVQQGNMQGAMDLQRQLAAQNGKFFEPRPQVMPAQVQQPAQVPAQGGKAPITLPPGVEGRPVPQVQQPLVQQPYFGNTGGPLVKPSPFPQQPQVLPARPMPANMAPQGLMGLQQTLAGQRLAPSQSAPAPGLNGVPGNQNPLYFGPGYR